MHPTIERHRAALEELCRRYRVRRLDVYGSANRDDFDLETSDVDLLVEFLPLSPGEYADTYFALREGLERLFGRPVDLTMPAAIRNPYFLESVNQSRRTLYAA